jgi:hypothetical protein
MDSSAAPYDVSCDRSAVPGRFGLFADAAMTRSWARAATVVVVLGGSVFLVPAVGHAKVTSRIPVPAEDGANRDLEHAVGDLGLLSQLRDALLYLPDCCFSKWCPMAVQA